MQEYPLGNYPSPDLAAAAVITDATIACPALEMDKLLQHYVRVWAYEFSDENAPEIVAPPVSIPYGASHFSELQYLFNMSALTLPGSATLSPAQQLLSRRMVQYWTEFAKLGNPNKGQRALDWGAFNSTANGPMQALEVPRPIRVYDFSQQHKCDFWRGLRGGV
jgi:para-nitrobenzyl esterase